MLFKRFTLFRFFGFQIKADASWIFLSVLITWTLSTVVFPPMYHGQTENMYQLMGVATLGGLFVSIIAHEVAHAIIAEYYHMPILSITLFIFGGVAEMKGEPSHPKGEFLMALAGPAMSAMMGLLFYAGEYLYSFYFDIDKDAVTVVLTYLAALNMIIAGFNLLPAFPLDGGRALRAVIWRMKNNLVLATRIVSTTGYLLAYTLIGYGCYAMALYNDMLTGIWSALLGLFVHGAAGYSVYHVESRSLLNTETVERFIRDDAVSVSPDITLSSLIDDYAYKYHQKIFPVVDRAVLVGVISLQNVMSIDRSKWQWLHVASAMAPITESNTVTPGSSAAETLELMQRSAQDTLLVAVDRKLVGFLLMRDLVHYLSVTRRLDQEKSVSKGKKAY